MKKLLMVIPSLKKGGAERVFSFIANEIDKDKFDVYLVVFDGNEIEFDIKKEKLTFISLASKSITGGFSKFKKIAKEIKPDVIFSTITHLNILIAFFSWFYKCKFVIRESSVLSINNKNQKYPVLFNFLVKLSYRNLKHIICQSKDMAEDLEKHFYISSLNIAIINNPVTFSPPDLQLETDKTILNLVTVGRLVESKGVRRLIDIVAKLDLNFTYVIVGDGPERENLQQQINNYKLQNKIQLVGQQDNVHQYYQNANLYLNGSFYEGFPNTLIEACAYGLPIISFDTLGGINEIITVNFNGLIVDSAEKFLVALKLAAQKSWDDKAIQADIYKRFSKESLLKEYEQILSL